jgi:hypothetical protein
MSHKQKIQNATLFSKTAPTSLKPSAVNPPPVDSSTLEMKLDHNNMMKSLKPKSKVTIPRLVKTTKSPPMRSYPGDVVLP